ncbi:hypothetical protein Tco_0139096 [Tanacetum coccineum]
MGKESNPGQFQKGRVETPRYPQLVVPPKKVLVIEAVHKEVGLQNGKGSGPRCQDTILGDVDAQTRFETWHLNTFPNDPPLSKVNTFGSGEDNMKILELMEIASITAASFKPAAERRMHPNKGRSIEDIDADAEVTLVNEQQNEDLIMSKSTKLDDSTAGEAVTTASVEDSVAPTIQVSTADIGEVTAS